MQILGGGQTASIANEMILTLRWRVKKIRITLNRGIKNWSFTLYDSAESAFYLGEETQVEYQEEEYKKTITLGPKEIIEIEWVGAEWVYDDGIMSPVTVMHRRFDKILLGKITPVQTKNSKSSLLETYSGWIPGDQVTWGSEICREGVKMTPVKGKMVSKIDLSGLFSSSIVDGVEDGLLVDQVDEDGPLN